MTKLVSLFPREDKFWQNALAREDKLWEVRIRVGLPASICLEGEELYLGRNGMPQTSREGARCFSREEISALLLHLCKYSPYAYEEELREGYLTLEGGHRLGVAGQAVVKEGKVCAMKQICFLNLRISHQVRGIGEAALPFIYEQGHIRNVLLVSAPGGGKTTLLRDLIRLISNGTPFGRGVRVGVVDERSELAGCCRGVPQNDLGIRTDVLDGCPKSIGMKMLIRSMAPEVLAVDELGAPEDREELREALRCGVRVIATIHGESRQDVRKYGLEDFFDSCLLLEKRQTGFWITDHWERGMAHEMSGSNHDPGGLPGTGLPIHLQAVSENPVA